MTQEQEAILRNKYEKSRLFNWLFDGLVFNFKGNKMERSMLFSNETLERFEADIMYVHNDTIILFAEGEKILITKDTILITESTTLKEIYENNKQ